LRLGLEHRVTQTLDPEIVVPAAGQGALAIECRADDDATRKVLSALHDEASGIAVACERAVMLKVGGGCSVPFGAHAFRDGEKLLLSAVLGKADGARLARVRREAPWPRTEAEAASIGLDAGAELVAD
jgi:hydroxymethylbilane synthase